MQIGARNRIEGEVTEIKRGAVMCQVKVRIAGDIPAIRIESVGENSSDSIKSVVGAITVVARGESNDELRVFVDRNFPEGQWRYPTPKDQRRCDRFAGLRFGEVRSEVLESISKIVGVPAVALSGELRVSVDIPDIGKSAARNRHLRHRGVVQLSGDR